MRRASFLVVLLLVAATLSSINAASAAALPKPVFVLPVEGTVVSGKVVVEATSDAPFVRFSMNPRSVFSKDVKVVGGTASASLSTLGLDGFTRIIAQSCEAEGGPCGDWRTTHVIVDNPAPVITDPVDEGDIYPSDDVVVSVDLDAGGVVLEAPSFRRLAPDVTEPFQFVLEKALIEQGRQSIVATACNASGSVCQGQSHEIQIRVHRPGLDIFGGLRAAISPNGDGVADSAVLRFQLAEPAAVTAEVWRGTTLVRTVPLGDFTADNHRLRIPADLGGPLPEGQYAMRYRASLLAAPTVVDEVLGHLTVDTTAPEVLDADLPYKTFYPHRDDYRDGIRPTARIDEAAEVRVQVVDAADNVLDQSRARVDTRERKYTHAFRWDGRLSRTQVAVPGVYRALWTFTDEVGNTSTAMQRFIVDDDQIAKKDVTLQVDAEEAIDWEVGHCSSVRKDPRSDGGRLLLSDVRCDSSPYDNRKHIIVAYYKVTLPKSLERQKASLRVYGGAVKGRSYLGSAIWIDEQSEWSDVNWSGPSTQWHTLFDGGFASTERALRGQRLYWISFVNRGMQYRIRDFTVRTTKAFLVEPATPVP